MRKIWKQPGRSGVFLVVAAITLASLPMIAQAQVGTFSFGGAGTLGSARTVFDNPAGMVRFESDEYILGFIVVDKEVEFEGTSNRYIWEPVEGTGMSKARNTAVNAFYVRRMDGRRWTWGLGIFSMPTIRDLQYDGIIAQITKEKFDAWNFGPAFAYKVTEKFSIGASINFQYADFWCNMRLPEFTEDGPLPDLPGYLITYGDDWEIGYRIGLLYQFTPGTRLGFNYISVMEHTMTGYSVYTSDNFPEERTDNYELEFPIPPIAVLSAHHDINDRWAIVGSLAHIWWEPYWQDVLLKNLAAPPPFTEIGGPLEMVNTLGYSVGVEFDPAGDWDFVIEFSNMEGQSVDRWRSIKDYPNGHDSLLLGAAKRITEQFELQGGYIYTKGKDAPITYPTGSGEVGLLTWDSHSLGFYFKVTPKKQG